MIPRFPFNRPYLTHSYKHRFEMKQYFSTLLTLKQQLTTNKTFTCALHFKLCNTCVCVCASVYSIEKLCADIFEEMHKNSLQWIIKKENWQNDTERDTLTRERSIWWNRKVKQRKNTSEILCRVPRYIINRKNMFFFSLFYFHFFHTFPTFLHFDLNIKLVTFLHLPLFSLYFHS